MKKLFMVVLCVLLAFSLFAGGKQDAVDPSKPVEITLLTYSASLVNGENRIQTAIDMYMAEHPNVKINLEIQSINDSVGFLTKLDLLQLTGDTGTIVQIPSLRELTPRAAKNFFQPLDAFFKAEGVKYEDEYGYDSTVNGQVYGIPFEPGFYGIYINKDMLDAAGLPVPKEGWTWDDYAEYAKAMTKGSGASKIYGSFMHSWSEFKREGLFNVVMDNPYVKADGTSNMDSKYFAEWLEYMWKLEQVDKSQTPYADVKATGLHYRDMFIAGKTAMIPIGSWMIDTVIDIEKYPHTFKTVVAPFPVFSDGKPGVTQGAASYYSISKKATPAQAQAAYDFLRWYSGEGAIKTNIFPSKKNADLISVLKSKVQGKESYIDTDSVIKAWQSPNFVGNQIGRDAALFTAIDKVYDAEASLYLLGTQDLNKTLSNIRAEADKIIKESK